jgi:hypothetical protein
MDAEERLLARRDRARSEHAIERRPADSLDYPLPRLMLGTDTDKEACVSQDEGGDRPDHRDLIR